VARETFAKEARSMIWIDPYYRYRFDQWEYVRGHWRRLPA
jgi:hypothetical protein